MNQLQVFNYEEQDVRMVLLDGVPWWSLKDVCKVLGIVDHKKARERLESDEVGGFDPPTHKTPING